MSRLRVAVLTTDTPHHRYFLREIAGRLEDSVELCQVIFETRGYPYRRKCREHARSRLPHVIDALLLNPYWQPAVLNGLQQRVERRRFFPDGEVSLPGDVPVSVVQSANDEESLRTLDAAAPDLYFVYGTGLLRPAVFERPPLGAINAHGGLVPGYRGLDTNLWACLEGAPEDMAVSLHQVDASLDTGPVYRLRRLPVAADLGLGTLRYHTTVLCTDMAVDLLRSLAAGGEEPSPQGGDGRYYGPMPFLLKLRAHRALRRYARAATTVGSR